MHPRFSSKAGPTLDIQLSKVQLNSFEQLELGQGQGVLHIALQV